MLQPKVTPLYVGSVALLLVILALVVGRRLLRGDGSLLRSAVVEATVITPDADGERDITPIAYALSRNATVSIFFEDAGGERFFFRREQPRGAGEYEVLFSGIVEPFVLPGELFEGEIEARLLQDGDYTWVIEAHDEAGRSEEARGRLTIAEADSALPELRDFSLDRDVFTPNRDGIGDRLLIQFDQQKEAQIRVFLLDDDGVEWPISELERNVVPGMPGRHYYDYEGGVDNGATPPPDGRYPIVAIAEDDEGQRIRVTRPIEIRFGGVPRADIVAPANADTLQLSGTAISLCETLTFTLTVENYGDTPIRTIGPYPGTVYDSDWNYNTLGWSTESGAWRLALGYENELTNYPFRWSLGRPEELTEIDGHYYLMPGQRVLITGGVRITGPLGERNPQPIWAGLIHEDVEISQFNNRVDPHQLLIDLPNPERVEACPERDLPSRTAVDGS